MINRHAIFQMLPSPEEQAFGKQLQLDSLPQRLFYLGIVLSIGWIPIVLGRALMNSDMGLDALGDLDVILYGFAYNVGLGLVIVGVYKYLTSRHDTLTEAHKQLFQILGVFYVPGNMVPYALDWALAVDALKPNLITPSFFVPLMIMYLLMHYKPLVLSMYLTALGANVAAILISGDLAAIVPNLIGLHVFVVIATRERWSWQRLALERDHDYKTIHSQRNEIATQLKEREYILKVVSHDLQNQVQIAKWYVEEMKQKSSPEVESLTERIERAIQNQSRIMSTARLQLSQKLGRLNFDYQEVDLLHVVQQVADDFELFLKQKQIHLETNFPQSEVIVLTDPTVMRFNILANVMTNAIKFSPKEGKIIVAVTLDQETASIVIRDFGSGLTPETAAYLLNGPILDSSEGTAGEKGTGFGLSIVRDALAAMSGSMTISSTQESDADENSPSGTSFAMTVPLASAAKKPSAA